MLDPPLSQNTFIYILSHESREAAKKSWASVLQDPGFKALIEGTGRLSREVGNPTMDSDEE